MSREFVCRQRKEDRRSLFALALCSLALLTAKVSAAVPTGSKDEALKYYQGLSKTLNFPKAGAIEETTLTDLAAYLGYASLTAHDLEFMTPEELAAKGQQLPAAQSGDVLVSRFFAPKIMNIKDPEATRKLGWRKLVRLRARAGSEAQTNKIVAATILFNIFTDPASAAAPFGPNDFSVNTQVMLVSNPENVWQLPGEKKRTEEETKTKGKTDRDTIYWLDYQGTPAERPGKLGFFLTAFFDANELQAGPEGKLDYFVPHGCAACHGNNSQRSMLNYLDTDHWFDRLNTDFQKLRDKGVALLVDAGTNDPSSPKFQAAFDLVRQFNQEADVQALKAQPKHDEALAAAKWLAVHEGNYQTVPPGPRAIGPAPQWSATSAADVGMLATLNQYCFRCHGTIKFSVFNKQAVVGVERWANLVERLKADAPDGVKMPPDRPLPDEVRALLLNFHP